MTTPRECESDSYYNLFLYECTNDNSTCKTFANSTFSEINQNIKACSCPENQYLDTTTTSCVDVSDISKYISLDGITQLTCDTTNMGDNCTCNSGYIRIHNSEKVICELESNLNEQSVTTKSKCLNGYLDDSESTCYCLSNYTLALDGCVLSNNTINYESTNTYYKHFYKAYSECSILNVNSTQSCQVLANLCALKMFDMSNELCLIYKNSSDEYNSDVYSRLPKVEFTEEDWNNYEESDILKKEMGTDRSNTMMVSRLPLYVYKYFLNGSLIGKFDLNNELIFVKKNASDGIAYRQFGGNREIKSTINIKNYKNEDMYFYEIFYEMDNTSIPVPILIQQTNDPQKDKFGTYSIDKDIYYDHSKRNNKTFYRRMFLYDNLDKNSITFAMSIKFVVEKKDSSDKAENKMIYLPYFEVIYKTHTLSSTNKIEEEEVIFTSYYYSELGKHWNYYFGFLITFLICGLVISIYRIYVWKLLNPSILFPNNYVLTMIKEFVLLFLKWNGIVIFWFCLGCSSYWYLFYRFQYRSFTIMPPIDQLHYNKFYKAFDVTFGIGWAFYFIHMINRIYEQCSFKIFFIDWEHDKEIFYESDRNEFKNYKENEKPIDFENIVNFSEKLQLKEKEFKNKLEENKSEDEEKIYFYNPKRYKYRGAWRMLHVANQFNYLQTKRQVSLFLCFGFVILFHYYTRWYRSTLGFIGHRHDEMTWKYLKINPILRHCIVSFVVLMTGIIQMVLTYLLHWWIPTKKTEFLDLCRVSNISLFILDQQLHGYYIHGMAPSGSADVNSNELLENLNKEAAGKIKNMGVKNESNEIHSFEIYISVPMKTIYDGLYYLHKEVLTSQIYKNIKKNMENIKLNEVFEFCKNRNLDVNIFANYMNEELKIKIQENFNELKVKTFVQQLLDFPDSNVRVDSKRRQDIIIYKDGLLSYDEVIFSGIEWQWFIMDVFFLQMFMRATDSVELGMLLTMIFDMCCIWIKGILGENNLSEKAVIDSRFLH